MATKIVDAYRKELYISVHCLFCLPYECTSTCLQWQHLRLIVRATFWKDTYDTVVTQLIKNLFENEFLIDLWVYIVLLASNDSIQVLLTIYRRDLCLTIAMGFFYIRDNELTVFRQCDGHCSVVGDFSYGKLCHETINFDRVS